ncbi:hypothetical protein PM082_023660 [Marasmius tenuissimus]|nr:hypothetical protein PM082_023660 [Marasmius tenuissimus]
MVRWAPDSNLFAHCSFSSFRLRFLLLCLRVVGPTCASQSVIYVFLRSYSHRWVTAVYPSVPLSPSTTFDLHIYT